MPQKPPLIPKKKGRPIELAEPLASIAEHLGGIQPLRARLNDVARATIHRWSDKIRAGEPLPPLVALAIQTIQDDIAKEKAACPSPNPSPSEPLPPSPSNGSATTPKRKRKAKPMPPTAPSSPSALASTLVRKTTKP